MARPLRALAGRPWLALLLAPSLALSACHGPGPGLGPAGPIDGLPSDGSGYPRPAPGIENALAFPDNAAGFHKRSVTQSAPGLTDYSIAYDDTDPASPSVVTLRFYRSEASLDALFAQEKQLILAQQRNAKLLGESSDSLGKSGQVYPSRTARFVFDGPFKDHKSPLYARLVVVALPGRFVNLRVTAPEGQQERTDRRTRQLLDAVDWTLAEPAVGGPSKGA